MAAEEPTQAQDAGVAAAPEPGLALHELVRKTRRKKGLSQQELASRCGIRQSALSTYERHGPEAQSLSAENIAELTSALGIPVEDSESAAVIRTRFALHFCPEPECPSVISYPLGEGRTGYCPRFIRAPADRPLYCVDCGEVCERSCPGCGAGISSDWAGAFCPSCGSPYVQGDDVSEDELLRRQRFRAELSSTRPTVEFRHSAAWRESGPDADRAGLKPPAPRE